VADWAWVKLSLSNSGPVALGAAEWWEALSPIEVPVPLKKDALGGSRGALSKASEECGGVTDSLLAVDNGRSSAMVVSKGRG
jgi:hypothetical protein